MQKKILCFIENKFIFLISFTLFFLPQISNAITTVSSDQTISSYVSKGQWKYYKIHSGNGARSITIDMSNLSNDLDLYVRKGGKPSKISWDCRPYLGRNRSETCTLLLNTSTTIYIGVQGYESGRFNLKAKLKYPAKDSNGNWNVPFLNQRSTNYDSSYKGAACGPTSMAMLLRFYYPNSNIDMPEIYNAGIQGYYKDVVSNQYSPVYLGMTHFDKTERTKPSAGVNYLTPIWGLNVEKTRDWNIDDIYQKIKHSPLMVYVALGGNRKWGHFLILRGIDTRGTSNRTDDKIYVNDPNNDWRETGNFGENKIFTYDEFFGNNGWFKTASRAPYAISFSPKYPESEREYTVVVDNGNYDFGGNSIYNSFSLDDNNSRDWRFFYHYGSWHYPRTDTRIARWTPTLSRTGRYQVSVRFKADKVSGNVTYKIYDVNGRLLDTSFVNQKSNSAQWKNVVLANSIYLSNGSYVRASQIAKDTNIDSIMFKYLGQ